MSQSGRGRSLHRDRTPMLAGEKLAAGVSHFGPFWTLSDMRDRSAMGRAVGRHRLPRRFIALIGGVCSRSRLFMRGSASLPFAPPAAPRA